ncbi:MAG: EutN/CcmL family microcompartment protein [Planctomycetota bacterium]
MYLAKVIGTVVASQKVVGMDGVKLVVVQPLDERLAESGGPLVACDAVQSGPGDLVWYCSGREATAALDESYVPVDATIVGHVDEVDCPTSLPTSPTRFATGEAS